MKAIVTASYSAIGHAITQQLLTQGYDVVGLNRDQKKSENQAIELAGLPFSYRQLDLTQPAQISSVSQSFDEPVDLLINNAGYAGSQPTTLASGIEQHLQVNTLAPLQLTEQIPLLDTAKVMHIGSSAMLMVRNLQLDSHWHQQNFKKMSGAYAHSKLALAHLAQHLASNRPWQITVDPGPTQSAMSASTAVPTWVNWLRPLFRKPESTASNLIKTLSEQHTSGSYLQGGKARKLRPLASKARASQAGVNHAELTNWYSKAKQQW